MTNRSDFFVFLIFLSMVTAMVSVTGCTLPRRLPAVPVELNWQAEIQGFEDIRFVVNRDDAKMIQEGLDTFRREEAFRKTSGHKGPLPTASYLAISGGGDNGAFAAGLLNGWTAHGSRPEFRLVTGISTGALIAPFAFLGPGYDDRVKDFFTKLSSKDIRKKRNLIAALLNDAMADNQPLREQLEKYVNRQLLDAVADEYEKGRLLLVATTDLDTRTKVIWNLTKIAAARNASALELFRSVMIASSAVPGVYPPVMIDVVASGQPYQEMHVDGGTSAQVFVYPVSVNMGATLKTAKIDRERSLFIIRNSRLDPDWASVARRTLSIAGRAISSMIQTQGVGDLYRIYTTTVRDGVDYNLAFIPASFNETKNEDFDPVYMTKLYNVGYQMAAEGYPWQKLPPGYVE